MTVFRFNPAPEFSGDVRITVPGSDEPATLRLKFRHLGREALAEWMLRPTKNDVKNDDYIAEVVIGWENVKDDEGRDVPFGAAALSSVLSSYLTASNEIRIAYINHLVASRAKN